MQYQFLNIFLDPKELLLQTKKESGYPLNSFLLENNAAQIEQIYHFYKDRTNLLFINGFIGTGKSEIANYSTNFLSDETIVLKYNCFNSTILDDILLSFFDEFKNLVSQNIIADPKVRTENFTQKVNTFFSQIEKPFVIIINSFEAILDENRQEIIDFILHLNSMQKVKIIIIGRVFENKYFSEIPIERITTLALDKEIFEKFLKEEKIKAPSQLIDDFFKFTRGYYFYTALSIKLIQTQNIQLADFLINLKNSYLSFDKFLEKETLTLVPSSEKNLFWFLSTIRHPVSLALLQKLDFCTEEQINFLIENLVVTKDKENVYIKDYLKENVEETAPPSLLQKIREYLIDLYNTQLPLKPLERDICISRQTMRKEMEFHKVFLPRRPKDTLTSGLDVSYLTYSKVFGIGGEKRLEKDKIGVGEKQTSQKLDLTKRKNVKINLENLPYQEKKAATTSQAQTSDSEKILTFQESIVLIKQAEKQYDYSTVIDLCLKALTLKHDEKYKNYIPIIYTKLASAYNKKAEHENALKYYEMAKAFYEGAKNTIKVNYIKFKVAKIYYETYKFEKSKELLLGICASEQSPSILIMKSYLMLAGLEEESSTSQKAFEYYKMALKHENEVIDPAVLSELYFKYALILDDKNDTKMAFEFYNKCINISQNSAVNKFLSPTYSNIAAIHLEKNDKTNAIDCYTKALNIDSQNKNFEGMYYSASKLATILHKDEPQKALEYYKLAIQSAEELQDVFYIISAQLAAGDYHYDLNQNEIALKYYLKSYDLAQGNLSKENIYKIDSRINDLKFRLGVEKFENLTEIIRS